MKRLERTVTMVLVGMTMAASLFANGAQEQGTANADGQKMSTEMNIVYPGTPQVQEKEYFINGFVKAFEDKYGVKVNVDFLPQADGVTKIRSEQESGNIVSDVIYTHTASMEPYVNGGWMEDITDLVNATGSTYTTMFDGTTNKDGRRYFLPNMFDVYLLIANVKALDDLPEGVTREDVEKGLSWDQYADWAVNIAKKEGVGKTMLPASTTGSQLLYPMGGMTLAYGGKFPEFNTDAAKAAYAVLAKIAAAGGFYPEEDQYSAVTDPMLKGDVWLAFSHMTPAGNAYNAAPNSFLIGAAPHGTAGAGSTSGAWCFGIQKNAPHKDLAEKWIQYVADPKVNYDFCYNFGGALSPVLEASQYMNDEDVVMKAGNNILKTAIVAGVPSVQFKDWNAVKLLFCDVFNEIVKTGAVPSDAFLDEKQAELDALRK